MTKIRKAVVPCAGFGTRFLPTSKSIPKEMLPVNNKPIIQRVVEDLVSAGVEDIVLVVNHRKSAIVEYFTPNLELEQFLEKNHKYEQLEQIKKIHKMANFIFVNQEYPKGTGDTILLSESCIGNEEFFLCRGDDFIYSSKHTRCQQLLECYNQHGSITLGSIISTDPSHADKYAFATGDMLDSLTMKVDILVEKPGIAYKPSDIAIVSGCIMTPDIFSALRIASKSVGDSRELVYVDGINVLQKNNKAVYARAIDGGIYYDCGNREEYLKTNIYISK